MKKAANAPRSRRWRSGETFIEVLIALLIVTLATLLLASMSTVSGSINLKARQNDERFYEALSKVEAMDSDAVVTDSALGDAKTFTVTIKDKDVSSSDTNVDVYIYEKDGLAAYKEATTP